MRRVSRKLRKKLRTPASKAFQDSPYSHVLDPTYEAKSRSFVDHVKTQAAKAQDFAKDATAAAHEAEEVAKKIVDDSDEDKTLADKVKDWAKTAAQYAKDASNQAKFAEANAKAEAKRMPDPPVDVLSQSIQFVIHMASQ